MPITKDGQQRAALRDTYSTYVETGQRRAFRDKYGGWTVGEVDHVWGTGEQERPPLLNLRLPDNSLVTSVPHALSVQGATGFYWE